MYAMLDRNAVGRSNSWSSVEYIAQGLDAADIGQALEAQQAKKSMLKVQISALELQILNGMQ